MDSYYYILALMSALALYCSFHAYLYLSTVTEEMSVYDFW
jgi:hypothetical protein